MSELLVILESLTISQIVVFNIPSELELVYSEPLTSLMGLAHPTEYCRGPRKYGKYPMNLNRGIDVIQTKLVGDSSVPLLSVIPLHGVFGEMTFKEYRLQRVTSASTALGVASDKPRVYLYQRDSRSMV